MVEWDREEWRGGTSPVSAIAGSPVARTTSRCRRMNSVEYVRSGSPVELLSERGQRYRKTAA
jgi:hypothetical protein